MQMFGVLLLLLFSTVFCLPQGDNYYAYDGYKVFRIFPQNDDDIQFLKHVLESNCESLKFPNVTFRPADMLCSPLEVTHVTNMLSGQGLNYAVEIHDMGALIRKTESPYKRKKRAASTTMNWDDYQSYSTITSWMEELATKYPSFTHLINMGSSVEGRKMYVMKIGTSPLGNLTRAVWLDGGIHAREWIAPSTVSYILNNLIATFSTGSSSGSSELQSVDWYVAPLLNPDGYTYSQTSDRLWRKNMEPPPKGSSCYGVDLNRNWNVAGYGVGASTEPCSNVYQGASMDSEAETQAIGRTILQYSCNIRVYITFHSYGQYVLTPLGYTATPPNNYEKQMNLGRKMINALQQCVNPSRSYSLGTGGSLLYEAGGSSDDWCSLVAKIPYSFTVELPDQSTFVLPPSEILPNGQEWWRVMNVVALEAARSSLGPHDAN